MATKVLDVTATAKQNAVGNKFKNGLNNRANQDILFNGDDMKGIWGSAVSAGNTILLDGLTSVLSMPPRGDNIVDPPMEVSDDDYGKPLRSFGSEGATGDMILVGRDYLERVVMRGQYLTLIPLFIQPKVSGLFGESKGMDVNGLFQTLDDRLNINNYGVKVSVARAPYWKAVITHMRASMMALGLHVASSKDLDDRMLEKAKEDILAVMPDHIRRVLGSEGDGYNALVSDIGEFGKEVPKKEETDNGNVSSTQKRAQERVNEEYEKFVERPSDDYSTIDSKSQSDSYDIRHASANNILKYITNIDKGPDMVNVPFVTFYTDGPIERDQGHTTSLDESAALKSLSTVSMKGGLIKGIESKFGRTDASDFIDELSYNSAAGLVDFGTIYVPKVMKGSVFDVTYNVNIRSIACGSDPFSIFIGPISDLCHLMPYYIERNTVSSSSYLLTALSKSVGGTLIPKAPMYCSAFSKGVINLPRAAITSVNIKTDPVFQTTEGVPTEITIGLSIVPLFNRSLMPDFAKTFSSSEISETKMIGDMFNPASSYNNIVTMCGFNSVLTNFPYNIFQYAIKGKLESLSNTFKGIKKNVSLALGDWRISREKNRNIF